MMIFIPFFFFPWSFGSFWDPPAQLPARLAGAKRRGSGLPLRRAGRPRRPGPGPGLGPPLAGRRAARGNPGQVFKAGCGGG